MRIVALYIQFRDGVPDEDRRRLYQHARLSIPEQEAVNSLVHLGVRISRVGAVLSFGSGNMRLTIVCQGPGDRDNKKKLGQKKPKSSEEEYELSRFKPALRTVLEVSSLYRLNTTKAKLGL